MKLDIPYYIRQVLREQRMVHIPGIGTFRLEQLPSHFNDDKSLLNPPHFNLSFDDQGSDNNALLTYILDTGKFEEDKILTKIEQYTQLAFNSLINVDIFEIKGIGKIKKGEDNDKLVFEPNLEEFTREFRGLNPIALKPIQRINEHVAPIGINTSTTTPEESGSLLPRILVLSLLLIALYFIGKHFYNSYSEKKSENTEIGATQKDVKDVKLAMTDSSELELEQKYDEIDELIDPKNGGDADISKDLKTEEVNSDNGVETSASETLAEPKDGTIQKAKEEVGEVVQENDDQEETKNINQNNNPKKPRNKYADIIPESGECIIVVGSFKKSTNTVRMISLLERKGYNVHQSQHNDFTRVGLIYECLDEDLEAFLQDIRKKISKKAWYLDPELEVPYLQ